jgi:hypothetical protein
LNSQTEKENTRDANLNEVDEVEIRRTVYNFSILDEH